MSTRYQLRLNRLPNAQGPAPSASSASPAPSPQPLAPHSPRRGILLLVVLGLLTLFLFIGTAFVISSNQFRLANRSYQRAGSAENVATTQRNFLDEVLNQLVRDTNNQNSVLRYHSLLRDLYGTDGFTATIDSIQWAGGSAAKPPYGVTEGQMIEFQVANIQDLLGNPIQLSDLSPIDGKYNGLLVTFLCGANTVNLAEGTTRIVSSYRLDPANTNSPYVIRVLSTPLANGQPLTSLGSDLTGLINTRIVVNGRPFNGTGVGYNPNATAGTPRLDGFEQVNLDTGLASQPIALMPNAVFFIPDNVDDFNTNRITPEYFHPRANPSHPQYNANATKAFDGQGGSDESYDAADFQNMFLAWSPPSPELTVLPDITNPTNPTSLGAMVLPSFHRPELINHWLRNTTNGVDLNLAANASMLRKIMLRPNWWDHPNFDGSNPYLSGLTPGEQLRRMVYGPWDVDNDKDGVPDSVWVDFGAPVIAGPDGKLVKPLAAILVLDLDGRLNVNAHGTRDMAGLNGNTTPVNFADKPLVPPSTTPQPTPSSEAPKGQAFGVAEISLEPLLKTNQFQRIINGANISGRGSSGRYATDNQPGISQEPARFDLSAQLKMQGLPTLNLQLNRTLYGSLPDYGARYALGLNNFGQVVSEAIVEPGHVLDQDNPYELNLSATATRGPGTSVDNPLSLAELERVLRAFDIDSPTLPPRLYELLTDGSVPSLADLNNWRSLLTTDSYDLPEPGFQMPEWVKNGPDGTANNADDYFAIMGRQPVNATYADLIEYRLRQAQGLPLVLSTAQQNTLRAQMAMLIAPEMTAGLKLDLNRPLGNDRDDNNNGVVDEPGEPELSGWFIDYTRAGISASPPTTAFENAAYHDDFDRDGDGTITAVERGDTNGDGIIDNSDDLVSLHNYRRQLLARHLYVLALAVVDPLPTAASASDKRDRSRQLAQWAINAVDFRDPDNIMTAFEYQIDPFIGWQVDGDITVTTDWTGADTKPGTNDDTGGVVWGTERPELVMTETLAWHDRRTEDSDSESVDSTEQDSQVKSKVEPDNPSSSTFDLTYDQIRPPKGAAFIELYNPWPASPGVNKDTHDVDGTGNDRGVNLAAVDASTSNSPVWRMAVYKTTVQRPAGFLTLAGPDKDPDSEITDNQPRGIMDRSVYFTDFDPEVRNGTWDSDGAAFYSSNLLTVPTVRPGRYLVVGAGDQVSGQPGQYRSHFGLGPGGENGSERGIILDTMGTQRAKLVGSNGSDIVASPPDITDVAIINQPRRFTLTEPTRGYPPINTANPEDVPFDDQRATSGSIGGPTWKDGEARLRLPFKESSGGGGNGGIGQPQNNPNRAVLRTIPAFSWIYLQRLANPLLPWNPLPGQTGHRPGEPINIYLTVDSMGTNVTVFNGSDREEKRIGSNAMPVEYSNMDAIMSFSSVQRGRTNNPIDPAVPTTAGVSLDVLHQGMFIDGRRFDGNRRIKGYLNNDLSSVLTPNQPAENLWNSEWIGWSKNNIKLFGTFRNKAGNGSGQEMAATADYNFRGIPDHTLGFLNEPFSGASNSQVQPEQPFPWITWNNRPYANPGELMQVPMRRSSQLLQTFSMLNSTSGEKYDGSVPEIKLSNSLKYTMDGPYGHLMNFFRHYDDGVDNIKGNTDDPVDQGIPGMFRVLDLVEVPSRYVGTETWLNPATFGNAPQVTSSTDPRYQWQPPFNRLPTRREPGKVNINTIGTESVWNSLFHGDVGPNPGNSIHPGPTDNDFASSRRGYGNIKDPSLLDAAYPTLIANPFRSTGTVDLVPLPNMISRDGMGNVLGTDVTLFRTDANTTGTPTGTPFSVATTGENFRNSARNPYFRYSPISRLSSMTTTRSNVFAVWITVGFFEVEEAPPWTGSYANGTSVQTVHPTIDTYNRAYPDGYTFGKEAGSDTGDLVRVRKFAIVDRTIPVGFQPGANHNVKETIRLKREVE